MLKYGTYPYFPSGGLCQANSLDNHIHAGPADHQDAPQWMTNIRTLNHEIALNVRVFDDAIRTPRRTAGGRDASVRGFIGPLMLEGCIRPQEARRARHAAVVVLSIVLHRS